jgi:predicted ester cyclase
MTSDENKAVARRYIEEFWSRGDLAVADELIAPDYVVHDPGTPGRTGGVQGEKDVNRMYRAVFPDLRFSTEDVVGEGDRAAIRWIARGTQRGELLGIAPTGRQVAIDGISIVRIVGGRIAEHWLNWDTVGMLQQLGAIPAPGQAPQATS